MRKLLLAGALVCAGAGLVWYVFLSHPSARRQPAASVSPAPATKPAPVLEQAIAAPEVRGRRSEAGGQRPEIGPTSALRFPPSDVRPVPATSSAVPSVLTSSVSSLPALPPATILENMRTTVRHYGSMFGGNPVGTNPEITRALNGDNPKQVKFLRAEDGAQINGKGELVDPWGTPYFFHQISGTEMEIRSAGPDKIMWTTDDLVTR